MNPLAGATGDHQWTHVNVECVENESPFGTPVAHGSLMLSLLLMLVVNVIEISGVKIGANHGLSRIRFTAPVLVGSRVHACVTLVAAEAPLLLPNASTLTDAQMTWTVIIEREG